MVTVWKLGVVPVGQFVPSKRQTSVLLICVSAAKRVLPRIAKFVPVVFVPVAFTQVNSLELKLPVILIAVKVPTEAKMPVVVTLVAVTFPSSAFQRKAEDPRESCASCAGFRSDETVPSTAKFVVVALDEVTFEIVVSPKIIVPDAERFEVVMPP